MLLLKPGDDGQDTAFDRGDARHDELSRNLMTRGFDPGQHLRDLFIDQAGGAQQLFAGLGGGIATGMTLKELGAQMQFKLVDMPDDRRVMHAQRLGRGADPAQTRHMRRGAYLGP